MAYAVYGTEALETVSSVVIFTAIAILVVPPFAFTWGSTAGQPHRIQYGSLAVFLLIPGWAIMAIWLSLIPFQSQLPLDRSEYLMWLVESAELFRSTYFVSSTVDSAASATSEILVYGIVAVVFGIMTVTTVFIVGEATHFVAKNLNAFANGVYFMFVSIGVLLTVYVINQGIVTRIASTTSLSSDSAQKVVCFTPIAAIALVVVVVIVFNTLRRK